MDRLKHSVRTLSDCHNIADFRALARRRQRVKTSLQLHWRSP